MVLLLQVSIRATHIGGKLSRDNRRSSDQTRSSTPARADPSGKRVHGQSISMHPSPSTPLLEERHQQISSDPACVPSLSSGLQSRRLHSRAASSCPWRQVVGVRRFKCCVAASDSPLLEQPSECLLRRAGIDGLLVGVPNRLKTGADDDPRDQDVMLSSSRPLIFR